MSDFHFLNELLTMNGEAGAFIHNEGLASIMFKDTMSQGGVYIQDCILDIRDS